MSGINNRSSNCGGLMTRAVCSVAAALLLCLMILPVTAGAKPYEEVGTFGGVIEAGEVTEEAQLDGASALAVNYTGAGDVPKGTVYAVILASSDAGHATQVARFTPEGSGLRFVERWDVRDSVGEKASEETGDAPYAICGPAVADPSEGLAGKPHCTIQSPNASQGQLGIAVDQATGNVYVGSEPGTHGTGAFLIHAYTPNGSAVIARFGEQGPLGQGTDGKVEAETPTQIHLSVSGWLAVNDNGEVFAFDLEPRNHFFHRLMVFKPKVPGNYSEYAYAGQSADIGAGFLGGPAGTNYLEQPVVDEAGNIYVKSDEAVEEYDPAAPNSAVCTFSFPQGAITAMTVDPATGEPFIYSSAKRPRRIHELSACQSGTFQETGETEVSPERGELSALAFDPVRQISANREPGALYGAAPGPVPGTGKGQPGTSALGYIFAQPEETPAVISELAPVNVTANSATLSALIDPKGFITHYAFRYLPQAQYKAQGGSFTGAAEAPAGGGTLIPANGRQRVEANVSGLEPDTTYVFQVVATSNCSPPDPSKACPVESSAAALHTYAVEAGLADGRAYELVSPPEKQGGQVLPANPQKSSCAAKCKPGLVAVRFPLQSTPDGSAVAYEGEPFGSDGALIENEYIGRRSVGGWETTTITPSLLRNREGNGYMALDPTLAIGVLKQSTPALTGSTPGEFRNLYRQETSDPESLTAVLTAGNSIPTCPSGRGIGASGLDVNYTGASTDLSRIFLEANDAVTGESSGACGQSNLYEEASGALHAVNLPPGGGTSIPDAVFGSGKLLESGTNNEKSEIVTHAISTDGSRAFFTGADGHLYVRIAGTTTSEVPGPGNCNKATPVSVRVCFLTASADSSSVLLSNGQIYSAQGSGTAYEPSVDLTQGQGGFLGIAGQSDDLSHLYFVDTADLTGGEENDQGMAAQAGKDNLYSQSGGTTHFVTTLAPKDGGTQSGDWVAALPVRTAEASPSGRWLAFQSVSSLTGFENGGRQEVFIYDSQLQSLVCASCNPSGARTVADTELPIYSGASGSQAQLSYLNDAGRLFFDSSDRLVPGDTNGKVEDLYEYEPGGLGGCSQAAHCLRLISSGRGSSDSNFLTADEAGDNVFFTTRDRLVAADKDELVDLYDARVGGGFAESPPPIECKAEACQQAGATPQQSMPSSMGLPTEGGAKRGTRPHCKKGQVKRKGRCLKKHRRHKGKAHHTHGARQVRKGGTN